MSDPRRCATCGARLMGERPTGGQCPACLLALAVDVPIEMEDGAEASPIRSCRVLNLLGGGPRGATYLAEATTGENRLLVLKVFGAPAEHAERETIDRRIATLVELRHPHIVPVLGGGLTQAGQPYVISQYVPAVPLIRHCHRLEPGLEGRLRLFSQVSSAVQYAHECSIVHGRLVTDNVLVSVKGGSHLARVTDFGIDASADAQADVEALAALRAELIGPIGP